ncbi:sulfotransferase 6B1-like isoform X2 [Hemicordylus capensis]|uniref:sulfotransferase 6B1-like isoform X2 n=1 Tax=Hemicordylus capensis TaxID=884348 RepID=UPI002302358F|nr:sulfotransferase 6B1-like isoform X2 [Hemicordylus capensis]
MSTNRKHVAEFLENVSTDCAQLTPEESYFSYKGVLYPISVYSQETFQALETFEARKDDVILAGYPKTGTNWLDHILNSLESTAAKYTDEQMKKRIALEKELEMTPRLEGGDPDKFKVLVLIRNPKDTMVSYFHFTNNMFCFPNYKWDEFFSDFMNGKVGYGSYFDHLVQWDNYMEDENVMVISYEELKENLNLGLKKIAKFFGFSLTEEEIQSVAEKSSFKAMKEKGSETHGVHGDVFFRKGIVGDWKSLLSESQSQEMDRRFEESVAGTKIGAKLKYEVYCKV